MAAFVTACARGHEQLPPATDAVEELLAAIEAGDAEEIWDLVGDDVRAGRSLDEFTAAFERDAALWRTQAERLAATDPAPRLVAELEFDAYRTIRLVHIDDRWLLLEQPPTRAAGSTPQESLEAIAAVLDSAELRDALTLLSPELAAQYDAERRALLSAVSHGADGAVRIRGDRAIVTAGELTLEFLHQEGGWRLDAIRQPVSYDEYYYE